MEELENTTNLIINYLPQTLTDDEFTSMFLSIGPIKSAKIVRDKATNYSFGFGFVEYHSPQDAERAIQTLNGLQIQNKIIKVALARPGGEAYKGANLYIRNVPKHFKEADLEAIFDGYGAVVQSRVLIDLQTGESKGVGFVLFSKKTEAEEAIAGMNGKPPCDGEAPLIVKFADDNTKKQQQNMSTGQRYNQQSIGGGGQAGPMRNPPGNRMRFNPMGGQAMNNYGPNNYGGPNMNYGNMYSYGGSQGHGYNGGMGEGNNYGGGSSSGSPGGTGHLAPGGGYIIYAYNIGYDCTEKELVELFADFGTVSKVNVIYDHQRGQCKGYGFVTMTNYREAQNAILNLNSYVHKGRQLSVSFKK
ncbi:ELAV-like protein 1 [Argopecten irradians]|uniref:ELAV-like protein 1 n=1 Tax=Argopecten irradians TaxID=31199 RepID=UPI0037154A28